MRSPAGRPRAMTVAEYLALEAASSVRHEYVAGEAYAMTGATLRHNRITGNVYARLRTAAAAGPCGAYVEAVKVQVADDAIYYPDVVVVCHPVRDTDVVVRDPCLVVEVTSPGTRRIDRGEKLAAYQRVASLQAYLVIDQARRRVQLHRRGASGEWHSDERVGEGTLALPCPGTTLDLDAIYEGVELPAVHEPEPPEYAEQDA